jgi:hypothetical protein
MKKIGILLFLAALTIGVAISGAFSFGPGPSELFDVASLFKGEKGSGHVVSEKRDLSGFEQLEVSGVFSVEATRGDAFSVEVIADDNLMPFIRTEVSDGTLSIYSDHKIVGSTELRVLITAPNITAAEASGASRVTLKDVKNSRLELQGSGAAKIIVSGSTDELNADLSGASKLLGADLHSNNGTIDTSGASNAEVNVAEALKAHASGASHIRYVGSPANVKVDKSGAASVSAKGSE